MIQSLHYVKFMMYCEKHASQINKAMRMTNKSTKVKILLFLCEVVLTNQSFHSISPVKIFTYNTFGD